MNRRTFGLHLSGIVAGSALRPPFTALRMVGGSEPVRQGRIEAVLFDAFPVFDPRSVARAAEEVFPGRGAELTSSWRTRQFEYAWLRVLMGDYADFWRCTEDALRYTATALRLDLTPARRDRLMSAFLELRPWPDVRPGLEALRRAGARLGFLSNFTAGMLASCLRASDLQGAFEHVLSTDRARTYKPDPRAYRLALDVLGLDRERILFVAFAGWDAAGARRFGLPTYWMNRPESPPEQLDVPAPDGAGRSMADLVKFVDEAR